MKKWIIITTILFVSLNSSASVVNDNAVKTKLLRNLEASKHDTTRLLLLEDLIMLTESNPTESILYVDKLLNEAEQQREIKYIARAYLYNMKIAGANKDTPRAEHWYVLLKDLTAKSKLQDIAICGQLEYSSIKNMYDFKKQEEACMSILQEARKVNSTEGVVRAYRKLAYIYNHSKRPSEAANRYEEAYILSKQTNNYNLSIGINNDLIAHYESTKDNEARLRTIVRGENLINEIIAQDSTVKAKMQTPLMEIYTAYVNYYVETGLSSSASEYIALANEINRKDPYISRYEYHSAGQKYYFSIGNYKRALDQTEALIEITKSMPEKYGQSLYFKASILSKLGRDKEAVKIYRTALMSQDTIQYVQHQLNLEYIKNGYDIDQLLLENTKLTKYKQSALSCMTLVITILVLILAVKIIASRSKIRKASGEIKILTAKLNQTYETTDKFLSNITSAVRLPVSAILENSKHLIENDNLSIQEINAFGREIGTTSDSIVKQIKEIIDISRLDIGMMKFHTSNVDLAVMVRDAIAMVAQRGIAISYTSPHLTLCMVKIDGDRFFQVLRSLMSKVDGTHNHISVVMEAKKEGSVTISVYGAALASKNRSEDLTVSNEINKMFVKHFGGEYEVISEVLPPYISITLPANKMERLYN